ncbi:hypothetical protein DAEQUDRAFT_53675 [Daedalea quercina L-15889]|uniref:F-box domain-containing protein n=1 Tax=Daedalea quercina L-15889 TaxID=1314783 RepID=A0A165LA00_9APHY|nr:hypothetical protein DAEQUDRAFT_53675 [Daedalea quercina L-15889]
MDLSPLNLDILHHIVSFTRTYDAFQLSLTCRDAHRIAVPRFLETIEFPLPWLLPPGATRDMLAHPETYEGFRTYMLADGGHRLRHPKSLTLGEDAFCVVFGDRMDLTLEPQYDFTLAASLVDVIRGAVGLRSISIHHSDALLDEVPELANAIASLPQLEEVCLHDADVSTFALLSRMQSRPHKVKLRLIEYQDQDTNQRWWGNYDFGSDRFLHNFTQSLDVLDLNRGSVIIEMLEPHTIWPAVREVKLVRGIQVSLLAIACAFPNLRRLITTPFPQTSEASNIFGEI